MSRHRQVRNINYDDYLDDGAYDDDGYDYDDYDYDEPDEPEQPEQQEQEPADQGYLHDLIAHFRAILKDDSLAADTIDAAIVATGYDVNAALNLLQEQQSAMQQISDSRSAALAREPSAFGKMLEDEEETPRARMPEGKPQQPDIVSVEAGTALRKKPGVTKPFMFDKPSPDDIVKMKQGLAGKRVAAVRLPKASALRGSKVRDLATGRKSGNTSGANASGVNAGGAKQKGTAKKEKSVANTSQKPDLASASSPAEVQRPKQRVKKIDLASRITGERSMSIIIAGHVDAGKSTLLCHMLQLLETSSRKKKLQELAWGTDEDATERERGVTIDIATRILERGGKSYALIDSPGHRDFVPAMILGAAQVSAGVLIIDSSLGEFEAGFSEQGQTKEHALVLKALGVQKLIVVINKMDVVAWDQVRYEEIKQQLAQFLKSSGWKVKSNVRFIPASGREGTNLISLPDLEHPLVRWYAGKSLLAEIESLPGNSLESIRQDSAKPTRLIVSDFFRNPSLGGAGAITGRLLCGSIAPKDKILISPAGIVATVRNVDVGPGRVQVAVAGADCLPVSLGLQDLTEGLIIRPGSVLCDPEKPVPIVESFRAQVLTTSVGALLTLGSRGILHIGGGKETVTISKLCKYVSGNRAGKVPRRLVKGDMAIVEFVCERPLAMERSADVKGLSRFAFRQETMTIAVGVVVNILKTVSQVKEDKDADGK